MSAALVESRIASNPRVVGTLFTLGALLVQAGNVAANGAGGVNGP